MGAPKLPRLRSLLTLGTAIAILSGQTLLGAEQPAEVIPLPPELSPAESPAREPAPDVGVAPEASEATVPEPLFEETAELGLEIDPPPKPAAQVYRPFFEPCRASRVYRSSLLGRLWARGEYLVWATKGIDVSALVTTSPLGTPEAQAGVPGEPGTAVRFGDEAVYDNMRSGGRFTLGYWWEPSQVAGVEATYFGLPAKALRHHAHGRGHRIVARPYHDVVADEPSAVLVAYPGVLDGSLDVTADTELQGVELLFRHLALGQPTWRVDLLGGYRYGRLLDRLEIDEYSTPPSAEYPPGTILTTTERYDLFKSTNDFHGGQFGLAARWCRGCWSVRMSGKVAVGGNWRRVIVAGASNIATTEITETDETTTTAAYDGGLLAMPTNIGYYTDTEVAVLSELGISVECQLTCDLRISVGYDLLLWNHVARAGEQIDPGINPTQIPPDALAGRPRPQFTWDTGDVWAQGLNVCIEQQF